MTIPFRKMHGLGNDFIVFDARQRPLAPTEAEARALADRHTGIGADTIAILAYVGTNSANPLTPNANGKTYAGDDNLDGIPNSETFDRSPGANNGTITLTAGPNGAVSIADAISNLNQIGGNCSSP